MEKNTEDLKKNNIIKTFINKCMILLNSFGMVLAVLSEALNQAWIGLPETIRNDIPNAKSIALILFALNTLAKIFILNTKKGDNEC